MTRTMHELHEPWHLSQMGELDRYGEAAGNITSMHRYEKAETYWLSKIF